MAQPQAQVPEKSNRRVWIIVVLVAVVVVVLMAGFFGAMFYGISGMMKDTEAYKSAIQTMEANARVMEILGPPVTTGFPSGNVEVSGPSGKAALAIPVEGQKRKGTLYIEATRAMGVWKTDRLVLQVDGGERIDLVGGTPI